MRYSASLLAAGLTLSLFSEASSAASLNTLSERLAYDLKVGGLHVADFLAEFDENETGYRTTLTMETRGMARWFQDFRAEVKGDGTYVIETGQGPTPVPRQFDRAWAAEQISSSLTIAYDPGTGLARPLERTFNPQTGEDIALDDLDWNRGRKAPLPVPDDMRVGVFDPMAAFVAARGQIVHHREKEFRIPIYDGRRRYDLVGRVEAPRLFWIGGEDVELVPVLAGIEPVFGFDRERTETMQDSGGKILFSPDDRFIPVQIILEGRAFTSVMNLTADCRVDTETCAQIAEAGAAAAE
ncbi:MAG: DUF3108 domain-containing protein [Alphaproteobacteria bacterium]|nr:DUF3108 domain-containing protein [Alphaproteobacteria bacterium]